MPSIYDHMMHCGIIFTWVGAPYPSKKNHITKRKVVLKSLKHPEDATTARFSGFEFPSARYLQASNSNPKMEVTFLLAFHRFWSWNFENEIFIFGASFWRILVSARPRVARISDLGRNFHFTLWKSDFMRKTAKKMYRLFSDPSCSPRATGHPWVGRIPKPAQNPPRK